MNILTIKNVALGLALTATALCAKAQKSYTEGVISYAISVNGQNVPSTTYFKGDSSAVSFNRGPASIKVITTGAGDYLAVLVDVPVASMKKAAIATPGELEEAMDKLPSYTIAPSADTLTISGFHCKKFVATDSKTNKSYDLWTTTDITLPPNNLTALFKGATGTPIKFTSIQMGTEQLVTLKSIADVKVPAGTFSISADYDKISLTDLQAMGGGRH